MEKKTPYFSHDMNAHDDQKIQTLITLYRFQGYGWFWYLLEMMGIEENYKLEESDFFYRTLARRFLTTEKFVKKFIDDCIKIKLIQRSEGYLYSSSFLERMRLRDSKVLKCRESGSIGGKVSSERSSILKANAQPIKLNEIKLNKKDIMSTVQNSNFNSFWAVYPRKESKAKALVVWQKINPNEILFTEIMQGLERYLKCRKVMEGFIQLATTWLNGKEWESVYEEATNSTRQKTKYEIEAEEMGIRLI